MNIKKVFYEVLKSHYWRKNLPLSFLLLCEDLNFVFDSSVCVEYIIDLCI